MLRQRAGPHANEAAKEPDTTQARISELVNSKVQAFSIDALVSMLKQKAKREHNLDHVGSRWSLVGTTTVPGQVHVRYLAPSFPR